MTKSEILSHFNKKYMLNTEQQLYLETHGKRFSIVWNYLTSKKFNLVLDIGPSFLSELLLERFGSHLNLMGFKSENSFGGHLASNQIFEEVKFIPQDLNLWKTDISSPKFDLIICGEVIEHLYTSPKILFQNFYNSLNKDGVIVIQTPNAVALPKRLRMLFGNNPYEMLRENLENPGHFREFTVNELKQLAYNTGFKIEQLILDEYFEYPSPKAKIYRLFKHFIPANLKSGITIILKK